MSKRQGDVSVTRPRPGGARVKEKRVPRDRSEYLTESASVAPFPDLPTEATGRRHRRPADPVRLSPPAPLRSSVTSGRFVSWHSGHDCPVASRREGFTF